MIALILFLLAIWVVLAVIGFVIHALFWLGVLAVVLFVITVAAGAFRGGSRSARLR